MGSTRTDRMLIRLQMNYLSWRDRYLGIETKRVQAHPMDASLQGVVFDMSKMDIGQEGDIRNHVEKFRLCQQLHPDASFILYGASRGAITTFNSLALNHFDNVRLVVLEGIFYSFDDAMCKRFAICRRSEWARDTLRRTFQRLFPQHSFDSWLKPCNLIEHFPPNIPVAFIASDGDRYIPTASTERLALELASLNRNPVYLLTLKKASHNFFTLHNPEDSLTYLRFMHALYRKHGLPFIPEYAEDGKELVSSSQLKNSFKQ